MRQINCAPAIIRVATAAFGLVALRFTYSLLPPHDFATYSLILFSLAVGSSIAAPINRSFWAHNSRELYVDSILWTWLILSTVLAVLSATQAVRESSSILALCGCIAAACCYAFSKIVDRFMYGQVLLERGLSRALTISLLMAMTELLVVVFLHVVGVQSLYIRLLSPAILFLATMFLLSPYRPFLKEITLGFRRSFNNRSFISGQLFTNQGLNTIGLSVLMTIAVMIDRLAITYFPFDNEQFCADYLLILSYTIALQSLLNVSIDLARKHVFRNNAWIAGANDFSRKSILFHAVACAAAIAAFPVFQACDLIPPSVSIWLWSSLVIRSIALPCCQLHMHRLCPVGPGTESVSATALYGWQLSLCFST